jgi:hypothetical protein
MKALGITGTAMLALLFATSSPAWSQEHEQEQNGKPARQEEKKVPEKSAKQEQRPVAQPAKNAKPEERNAPQHAAQPAKNAKPGERNAPQHAVQAQSKQARGGRIPDDRFKANFGRQHAFHVSQRDYGNRRFQYGGYSFGFVDPWPSNWLYTQDVYVVEINGVYYLCNPMYPGVNIALNIVL